MERGLYEYIIVSGFGEPLEIVEPDEKEEIFFAFESEFVPKILNKKKHKNCDLPKMPEQIEKFIHPEEYLMLYSQAKKETSHEFILTLMDGSYLFCFTLTIYPLFTETDQQLLKKFFSRYEERISAIDSLPPSLYASSSITVISRFPYHSTFTNLLIRYFNSRKNTKKAFIEQDIENLSNILDSVNFLSFNNKQSKIIVSKNNFVQLPKIPPKNSLPNVDVDFSILFLTLTAPNILRFFFAILNEKKIIVTSKNYSKLIGCCEAMRSLLFPFKYPYVYIPFLPLCYIVAFEAPITYFIGCHSSIFEVEIPPRDAVIVNLDKNLISFEESIQTLPPRMTHKLLNNIRKYSNVYNPQTVSNRIPINLRNQKPLETFHIRTKYRKLPPSSESSSDEEQLESGSETTRTETESESESEIESESEFTIKIANSSKNEINKKKITINNDDDRTNNQTKHKNQQNENTNNNENDNNENNNKNENEKIKGEKEKEKEKEQNIKPKQPEIEKEITLENLLSQENILISQKKNNNIPKKDLHLKKKKQKNNNSISKQNTTFLNVKKIRISFLKMFISLLFHYKSFVLPPNISDENGDKKDIDKDNNNVKKKGKNGEGESNNKNGELDPMNFESDYECFDGKGFLKISSTDCIPFLKGFIKTQMFISFIEGSLAEDNLKIKCFDYKIKGEIEKQQNKYGRILETKIKKGYLVKQGNVVQNWKKRYFILNDGVLKYYKIKPTEKNKKKEFIKEIPLRRGETQIQIPNNTASFPTRHVFYINNLERTYKLCCKTQKELSGWVWFLHAFVLSKTQLNINQQQKLLLQQDKEISDKTKQFIEKMSKQKTIRLFSNFGSELLINKTESYLNLHELSKYLNIKKKNNHNSNINKNTIKKKNSKSKFSQK
ncbi:c-myc promoter binding protein [Anaeramoeba flamelloides]|uniref:C-myc promoter binding protein n=1 Tax=Anaeramoeba flamelloides TaxID=1746091 RepID=A0AAV7YUN4_9EUKA|nr:c-myc promoter binding protein [Anaeramoeba flamelloides]